MKNEIAIIWKPRAYLTGRRHPSHIYLQTKILLAYYTIYSNTLQTFLTICTCKMKKHFWKKKKIFNLYFIRFITFSIRFTFFSTSAKRYLKKWKNEKMKKRKKILPILRLFSKWLSATNVKEEIQMRFSLWISSFFHCNSLHFRSLGP